VGLVEKNINNVVEQIYTLSKYRRKQMEKDTRSQKRKTLKKCRSEKKACF
jgi:hypothetical protein